MHARHRRFDNDQLSVVFFLQNDPPAPYIYIRTRKDPNEAPWVAVLGAHELVIKRDRESDAALVLSRWSTRNNRSKPWARLQFTTWEGRFTFVSYSGELIIMKKEKTEDQGERPRQADNTNRFAQNWSCSTAPSSP